MDVWQTRKGLSSPTTTLLPELPPKKLKHPTKELRGRIFEYLKFDLCTDRTFVLFLQNLLLSLLQNLYLRISNFAARTIKRPFLVINHILSVSHALKSSLLTQMHT